MGPTGTTGAGATRAKTGWNRIAGCGPATRRVFRAAGLSSDDVLLWFPDGRDELPNVAGADGWTPTRLAKFVQEAGGDAVRRAVEVGCAETKADRAGFYLVYARQGAAWLAETLPRVRNGDGLRLAQRATFEVVAPAPERVSREDWRHGWDWAKQVAAFTQQQVKDWLDHPAAGLPAPPCPHVPAGWAAFGPFVPWMVAAGYAPQNAPRAMNPGRAADAVALVNRAVAGWERDAPDPDVPWWSDDWYAAVGIDGKGAAALRAIGWEPPLGAFARRWGGVSSWKATTVASRFRHVPVETVRTIWREGLAGIADATVFLELARVVAPADVVPLVRATGSVWEALQVARAGLGPPDVEFVDRRWPGHRFFDWVAVIDWETAPAVQVRGRAAGWLQVAARTGVAGEPMPPTATLGDPFTYPGWVPDLLAAGIIDPDEAMALLDTGLDRDAVRMMGALRL